MGLVTFRDARRVEWQVCEVSRTQIDAHRERRRAGPPVHGRGTPRSLLPGLDGGWLSFESWWQKRRLTSYPADWRELPSSELERLCERALVVPEPGARGAVRQRDTPILPDALDADAAPASARVADARATTPREKTPEDVPGAAALRRAVQAWLPGAPLDAEMRFALQLYGAAFRARGSDAAQLVVALEALLARIPEVAACDAHAATALRTQIVSAATEELHRRGHEWP